jgi:hypothetical protein
MPLLWKVGTKEVSYSRKTRTFHHPSCHIWQGRKEGGSARRGRCAPYHNPCHHLPIHGGVHAGGGILPSLLGGRCDSLLPYPAYHTYPTHPTHHTHPLTILTLLTLYLPVTLLTLLTSLTTCFTSLTPHPHLTPQPPYSPGVTFLSLMFSLSWIPFWLKTKDRRLKRRKARKITRQLRKIDFEASEAPPILDAAPTMRTYYTYYTCYTCYTCYVCYT